MKAKRKKAPREATENQKRLAAIKRVEGDQWREWLEAEKAEGWRPEPGSVLYGEVADISIGGAGSPFGAYPLLTIRTESGGEFVKLHAFHTVLRNQLKNKSVGEGDRVIIEYRGFKEVGGDFGGYEDYTVVVRHRSTEVTRLRPVEDVEMASEPDGADETGEAEA